MPIILLYAYIIFPILTPQKFQTREDVLRFQKTFTSPKKKPDFDRESDPLIKETAKTEDKVIKQYYSSEHSLEK